MQPQNAYFAVIFTGTKTDNTDGYDEAAMAMFELASKQDGFISIDHSQMGNSSVTISYWHSLEAIHNWKNHPEHRKIQEQGKHTWYKHYQVKIAHIIRDYSFEH
ncbi:MAG: antibiotic biosynthesis monooxygenase [Pseudomonadales bacterium]|nr:antibiotic biosynthesis monooxygenase [Pseudomonadales bacterium]